MSNKKSMEEVSVAELICNYNLVIPEIQREYVWGLNTHGILDTFILDIKEGFKEHTNDQNKSNKELEVLNKLLQSADDIAKNSIKKMILDLGVNDNPINIGFLYSYRPDYYVFNDRNEDVYLIDGQQRFTTLFLILFYLALKENRKQEFEEMFRFNQVTEHIAFDYRVRTLTHNFFIDMISHSNTIDDLINIKSKNWFLSNYKNDITVNSIVGDSFTKNGTFPILHRYFEEEKVDYFDYVKSQIKFWHFKTEETSQGEELYITMNSRGQQLADNENIRAKLFEAEELKSKQLDWSEKWEQWQDFFWKHRDKVVNNTSADKGFNDFLRWVAILEMFNNNIKLEDEDGFSTDLKGIIKGESNIKLPIEYLKLEKIELYMDAVRYLFDEFPDKLKALKSVYSTDNNFNLIDNKWLSPKANNLSQILLFRLLPILHFISIRFDKNRKIDDLALFRLIRFIYNLRQDETVGKTPDVQLLNALDLVTIMGNNDDVISILGLKGISKSLLNEEETKKLNYFKNVENRTKLETWFWISEDHKESNGKISHIIGLAERASEEFDLMFDSKLYFKCFVAYKELLNNHSDNWGNFLKTDVYQIDGDRILCRKHWQRNEDYLNFSYDRYLCPDEQLNVFFEKKQKEFIQGYDSENDLSEEKDYKKQLFIYFILNTQLNGEWYWHGNWNFGVYSNSEESEFVSIFNDNNIYQKYNHQWRYSFGYNKQHGIWTQHKNNPDFNYFQELIKWANN